MGVSGSPTAPASACGLSARTTSSAYDFVAEKTHDGRALKLLTVVDEYTRERLAIVVARRITSHDVIMTLADLFLEYGVPEHIRSDIQAC